MSHTSLMIKKLILFTLIFLPTFSFAKYRGVIYGTDNRVDIFEVLDPKIQALAHSTVAIIAPKSIEDQGNGRAHLKTKKIKDALKICPDERFAEQEAAVYCTGFLVAPDVVMTAGHCIESQMACKNSRFLFDFGIYQSGGNYREVALNNIYGCSELLFSENPKEDGEGIDLAVVRLDRKVTDRAPVELENQTVAQENESLFLLGHPLGLPLKYSDEAVILKNHNKLYFKSDLDAYTGNSGSPVFSEQSLKVKGVLVSGEDDFEKPTKGQCRHSKICLPGQCDGELVLNIAEALLHLPLEAK